MTLQDIIHYIEVGAGKRFMRIVLPCLAILVLGLLYDSRSWRNFSAPEAMDSAQLARNIANGKGYTTLFIRPLSVYLVQEHNKGKPAASPVASDPAQIKTAAHPDLANAPVYPMVLAGLMKILPFHFAVNLNSAFWANNGIFWRYQPDFIIGIFNQLFFFAAIAATYFIARKLFDDKVAQLATFLTLVCDVLWHFSASGLSTMLLLLIFLAVVWCVLKIEEHARAEELDTFRILCWAAATGILTGIGALTRYSFGWVIIPVAAFLLLFSGPKKFINALVTFGLFAVVLAPWIARNVAVSGTLFGTAGYSILSGTYLFPGSELERTLNPDFTQAISFMPYWHKFLENFRPIIDNGLLSLGGNWVGILFFAGLLLGFKSPAVRRMRYFLLMCLATFIVVQALGRTSMSDETPEINSENMLVLTVPLVIIFGTAFFFILLEQMRLPARELRYVVIGLFLVLCSLPLFFSMWFKSNPVVYPPYYPPDMEKAASWMKPNELIMSDTPWAVAWYGQRQSVWLSGDAQDSFFAFNDYVKPVSALYLSMRTMDGRLVSDSFRGGKDSWGHFVLNALTRNQIPTDFPLRHSPSGDAALTSGFFLTDAERWKILSSPTQ